MRDARCEEPQVCGVSACVWFSGAVSLQLGSVLVTHPSRAEALRRPLPPSQLIPALIPAAQTAVALGLEQRGREPVNPSVQPPHGLP